MPTDLDILMSHVHEINAKKPTDLTEQDLNILIAYYRNQRARRASGHKIAKPEKPAVDVLGLLNVSTKPKVTPGSVRRL